MEHQSKKTRRRYSEREKAAALAIYDRCGNLSEAARLTGIPDSTLHGWRSAKPSILNSDVALLRAGYEPQLDDLANRFEEMAHLSTGETTRRLRDPKQVKEIGLHGLLRAAEVGAEKSQLLRGQPTSIIEERLDARALVMLLRDSFTPPAERAREGELASAFPGTSQPTE